MATGPFVAPDLAIALTGSTAPVPAHEALSWLSLRFAQKLAEHLNADWANIWRTLMTLSNDDLEGLGTPNGWRLLAEIVERTVGKASGSGVFTVTLH